MTGVLSILGVLLVLTASAGAVARPSKRSSVVVECSVHGATVVIDGKKAGTTPLGPQVVAAGKHTIKVKKLGFLDFVGRATVAPGESTRLFADLLPFAGVIKVTADVVGALVRVDGKVVGKTPHEQEVKLGRHTITVSAPGATPHSQTIVADPGQVYEISATLTAPEMDLALVPPAPGGHAEGDARGAPAGEPMDELALAPLVPAKPADDDPLALAPLVPIEASQAGDTEADPLALAALPVLERPPAEIAAVDPTVLPPAAVNPGGGIGATVEPPKPWYMEWWVWSVAGAVVVGGVATSVALAAGGDEPQICHVTPFEIGKGAGEDICIPVR